MATNQSYTSSSTVVGYFPNRSSAEQAVSDLRDAGFTSSQIGVSARSSHSAGLSGSQPANASGTVRGTAESAGAKARNAWDKVVDFFEGKSTHERREREDAGGTNYDRTVPTNREDIRTGAPRDVEPYVASGSTGSDPGVSAPSEYGERDYEYHGEDFEGALSDLRVPQERARYFRHQFDRGPESAIVTVTAPGRETEAEDILRRNGADLGANAVNYDTNRAVEEAETGIPEQNTSSTAARENFPRRIQLLGETLRVHKERISRGDVRLRKQVVSETQTIQVPVTREELVIERAQSGQTQAPVDAQIGSGGEIRVPLSEERATVEKQPYVREEVSVGKRTVSDVKQFEERVRREELAVDEQSKERTA